MSDVSGPQGGGAERRAYARLSMTLPAALQTANGPRHSCVIKDYCPGGVFVELDGTVEAHLVTDGDDLQRGGLLTLSFSIETDNVWRDYSIQARLAKAAGSGVGLSFLDGSPEAVQALGRVAQAELQARNERLAQRPARAPEQDRLANELLELFASRAGRFLEDLTPDAIDGAGELAFTRSLDAVTSVEQNEFLDAKQELEDVRGSLVDALSRRVVDRVRRLPEGGGGADTGTVDLTGSGGLSLVDTGSFDEWVAIKNMVGQAEPSFKDQSAGLDAQASFIAGMPIEHTDNPLGLSGIAFAFHDAMRKVVKSARAREVLVESFQKTLLPELKSLYVDFGKMFEDRGVRPKPATGAQPARRTPSRPATATMAAAGSDSTVGPGPDWDPTTAEPAPHPAYGAGPPAGVPQGPPATAGFQSPPSTHMPTAGYAPTTGQPVTGQPMTGQPMTGQPMTGQPMTGQPMTGQPMTGQPMTGGWPATGQPGPASAIPGSPFAHVYPAAAPAVPMASVFGAAQNILSFARNADVARRAAPQSVGAAGPGFNPLPASRPLQDRTALLDALASFQEETLFGETVETVATSVSEQSRIGAQGFSGGTFSQSHTATVLSDGTTVDSAIGTRLNRFLEDRGVQLEGPESDSVEVISRLIDAVVADPLVGQNVKHRVKRLAVPLLKLALEDESLFANQAHPARQVVNKLGALSLPSKAASDDDGPSLRASVDPLIEQVANARSNGAQAFSEVLPKLDALIEAQAHNYNENVRKVIQAREEQSRVARDMRAKDPTRAKRATRAVPPEWQRWLSRAKNIQLGDALRVDEHGSGNPKIMRLAWKDSDDSGYQFVDGAGNKGVSLSQQELAMYLRRGWADHVDDAELPVLDRGMFKMLENMQSEMSEEVAVDPVSGLTHRRMFEARLARALEDAGYGEGVVVGVIDLDNFSKLDEKVGRKAGDALLKQLGTVLGKHIKGERSATRLAADDFAFLTEGEEHDRVLRIAERLRRAIEASSCVWKGKKIPLSVSVGIAASSESLATGGTLVEAAKTACDAAKRKGGNCIVQFDEALSSTGHVEATQTTLDETRLVLRQQEVRPLAEDGKVKSHFEVLLGIHKDDGTIGNPQEVVLAAEKANEVRKLDEWVVRNTLRWMANNRGSVVKCGGYAINLSGQSLSDETLLTLVVEQLTETKVPPGKVIFEITETAAIDGLSQATQFIRTLREYGCRFAIDDFGVGHAPFAYLKTLPVDYVKIDGMFIRGVAKSSKDYGLVKSMSDTAQLLGKQSIAEFVESADILETLREIGVDFVQGFHIAKPTLLE